jgi:ubiquinone/menaquinone biosynthesis C-methylase UbiE
VTESVYGEYYRRHGSERNDLLNNPEVLFQTFAMERATIAVLQKAENDRQAVRVLDVGCGSGSSILQFLRLGFRPGNLAGVDNSAERVEAARDRLPNVEFHIGNAEELPFADGSFDLVCESTMLSTLDDRALIANIAKEMLRVTRIGGYVMVTDWRYSRKGTGVQTAMTPGFIRQLFSVGEATSVVAQKTGSLVPPVGRRLSRAAPSLYFLIQRLFPVASGQLTTLLVKRSLTRGRQPDKAA